jgi:hypothetical protein
MVAAVRCSQEEASSRQDGVGAGKWVGSSSGYRIALSNLPCLMRRCLGAVRWLVRKDVMRSE